MKPLVLIFPGSHGAVVVVTPNDSHDEEGWGAEMIEIREKYADEVVFAPSETGFCEGAPKALEFFSKHPEWECDTSEGIPFETWTCPGSA